MADRLPLNNNNPPPPAGGAAAAAAAAGAAAIARATGRSVTPDPTARHQRVEKIGTLKPTNRDPKTAETMSQKPLYILAHKVATLAVTLCPPAAAATGGQPSTPYCFDPELTVAKRYGPLLASLRSGAHTEFVGYTAFASSEAQLQGKLFSMISAWTTWGNNNKIAMTGDNAMSIFPIIKQIEDYQNAMLVAIEAKKAQRAEDRAATAEHSNQLVAAEMATLAGTNNAMAALPNAHAAAATQQGRARASGNPALMASILGSAGTVRRGSEGDDEAKKQSSEAQKPSFNNFGGQMAAMAEQQQQRSDKLVEMITAQSKDGNKLQERQLALSEKRSNAMVDMSRSMAKVMDAKAVSLKRKLDEKDMVLDEKDMELMAKAEARMKNYAPGTAVHDACAAAIEAAAERMTKRHKDRAEAAAAGAGGGAAAVAAPAAAAAAAAGGGGGRGEAPAAAAAAQGGGGDIIEIDG